MFWCDVLFDVVDFEAGRLCKILPAGTYNMDLCFGVTFSLKSLTLKQDVYAKFYQLGRLPTDW